MEVRNRGMRTSPKKKTAIKKIPSPPRDLAIEPIFMPSPLATPVISAITPTQIISSQTDVPRTYFTKGRELQRISSITLARSVVAESQMAAPRNSEGTTPHPRTVRAKVKPRPIITTVSRNAVGRTTFPTFLSFVRESPRPIVNIRNTIPSCPMV